MKFIKNHKLLIFLLLIFILLSYVKFFTVKITMSQDPTVAIVKTNSIHFIDNKIYLEENGPSLSSYNENGNKIIYANESTPLLYDFLLNLWWIILISPLFILLTKKLNKSIFKAEN